MRFGLFFLVFIFLSFVVWSFIVYGESGKPSKGSQWIFDAYEKKTDLAKGINTKKIVIIAGSNILFGVDSKMLEKEFDLPVLNDGVNAGVELPCVLQLGKKVIKENDIVIMPLEYPMYSYDGTPGLQMIDYVLSRESNCFFELTLQEEFYILWHVSFGRIWDGYFSQSKSPVTSGLYGAHHIDAHGDQIQSSVAYRSAWMHNEVLNNYGIHPEHYGADYDAKALGWKYLEDFMQWCGVHHVRVIFMPSTLMRQESYFTDAKERWLYEHIGDEVRKRGWEFVGKPYDYMYDKEMYFNTNFHLVDKARHTRTEQMISDLKNVKL